MSTSKFKSSTTSSLSMAFEKMAFEVHLKSPEKHHPKKKQKINDTYQRSTKLKPFTNTICGLKKLSRVKDSLGLHPDLPVHDGCSGDTASQRVNFKQPTTARRPDGIGHLTIWALIHIFSYNLNRYNIIINIK